MRVTFESSARVSNIRTSSILLKSVLGSFEEMQERYSCFSRQVLDEEIDLADEYDNDRKNKDYPTCYARSTSKTSSLVQLIYDNMDINNFSSIRPVEDTQTGYINF